MEGSRSCTTLPQGAGSGRQRAAGDHFDPHAENVAWKVLETTSSWSKALGTLVRAVGLEELGVVKPREHRAKVAMQDNHREDHQRTLQEVIARARKHVWISKDTQRAKKLLRGEAEPKGLGYIKFSDEDPGDRAVLVGVHNTKTAILEALREPQDEVKMKQEQQEHAGG